MIGALNALTSLGFAEAFRIDLRKINNLVLTVDQEVGGSNPPSCTKHLARPVGNVWEMLWEMAFSRFVPLCLSVRDALLGDPT